MMPSPIPYVVALALVLVLLGLALSVSQIAGAYQRAGVPAVWLWLGHAV